MQRASLSQAEAGSFETNVHEELCRARDAWRGTEGELARSKESIDELRSILLAVSHNNFVREYLPICF